MVNSDKDDTKNYIFLPLIIDNLSPLDEKDLEFATALINLVSVALDRFYMTIPKLILIVEDISN